MMLRRKEPPAIRKAQALTISHLYGIGNSFSFSNTFCLWFSLFRISSLCLLMAKPMQYRAVESLSTIPVLKVIASHEAYDDA
jgi:hypothetical protein